MRPRHLVVPLTAVLTLLAGAGPAAAHDDRERMEEKRAEYSGGLTVPLAMSPNVNFVSTVPDTAGISGCFAKTAPYFYMSSLDSISVYDTSNALRPTLTGTVDNIVFENEAMNCGERKTTNGTIERFVLVGNNLADYSTSDIDHSPGSTLADELIVFDVTDPTNPHIRSRVETTTSDHTVTCVVDTDCRYVYTSGGSDGSFSIIDLNNLDAPVELDSNPGAAGTQPFISPTAGHKWNFDDAGHGIHTGYEGSGIFDVSDPRAPRLVTTTGKAGQGLNADGTKNGFNDFIHHNSFRPNASAFKPDAAPSFANGNILLVTEEDYEDVNCATAGSFQTWHVKKLDGTPEAIVPLDKVELADLGTFALPVGAFCSAHWFDYHPSGIVAVGYYGGGLQLVDARDPLNLKSYGAATWGVSEVWDAYWVPVYNKNGTATGKKTNIVYTVDLVRGLDVYAVDLPGGGSLADTISLASATSSMGVSRPLDALPITLVGLVILGSLVVRRRAARQQPHEVD